MDMQVVSQRYIIIRPSIAAIANALSAGESIRVEDGVYRLVRSVQDRSRYIVKVFNVGNPADETDVISFGSRILAINWLRDGGIYGQIDTPEANTVMLREAGKVMYADHEFWIDDFSTTGTDGVLAERYRICSRPVSIEPFPEAALDVVAGQACHENIVFDEYQDAEHFLLYDIAELGNSLSPAPLIASDAPIAEQAVPQAEPEPETLKKEPKKEPEPPPPRVRFDEPEEIFFDEDEVFSSSKRSWVKQAQAQNDIPVAHNQNELDAAVHAASTWIRIDSPPDMDIVVDRRINFEVMNNSHVIAMGDSQVMAFDSSQVDAYDASQVKACDASRVRAFGSSRVTAYSSSQVEIHENSQLTDLRSAAAYNASRDPVPKKKAPGQTPKRPPPPPFPVRFDSPEEVFFDDDVLSSNRTWLKTARSRILAVKTQNGLDATVDYGSTKIVIDSSRIIKK